MTITCVTEERLPQAAAVYREAGRESHRDLCTPEFLESRDCGAYREQQMAAGKRLYLLSNYPKRGYLRMREKFADRFEVFDGGVISWQCHFLKPEKEIYQLLIENYGLTPEKTLFIDDMLGNVEGAQKEGIHGFHMHEKGMMDRFFL